MINKIKSTFISGALLPMVSLFVACVPLVAQEQATIQLTDITLMHEMRATPFPQDGATLFAKAVSFQWPLPPGAEDGGELLDGISSVKKGFDKSLLNYRVRYSQDSMFHWNVEEASVKWPFYNPEQPLAPGSWYWQYGYVQQDTISWSDTWSFIVKENADVFTPPSFNAFIEKLPAGHPWVWIASNEWDAFRVAAQEKPEYQWHLDRANRVLQTPMKTLKDINVALAAELTDEVKRKAMLTRESRRIIDSEEANTESLIRAYLLTKDKKYFREGIKRVIEMSGWGKNSNVVGDFNAATMLSLSSMAYDSFYELLTEKQKKLLLENIKEYGDDFFANFNNRLENHIADNHVWQMTFRIFTMATFSVYGELPQAEVWANYCYNLWMARFPGLNQDGGWHNGDSYFSVNTRTLIEVPYFYTRVTGFNYFDDPWYRNSAAYTVYAQPPFSHASGNGSSHRKRTSPNFSRVSYADALSRITDNTYLADYVKRITAQDPDILKRALLSKEGDLAWFRLQYSTSLPEGSGLESLPLGHVFPQTGLATFQSDWKETRNNAMLTFRSSPYGSTSHALANQNAFNTYYGGKPLFYSSGHHIEFTDQHSMYCHRGTRAHNTILVNGIGQRIGTEGYGWIPRHYTGKKINYVVGDASNAYGEVISSLWKERGDVSGLEFTPANGWGKSHLNTFRRHIVTLEGASLIFVYDELEADTALQWNYLLHTAFRPMEVANDNGFVHVRASNEYGMSDAYLFASGQLKTNQTDQFLYPAVNWLRADANGHFEALENHYHFTATTHTLNSYRFATIVSTHANDGVVITPQVEADGTIRVGQWMIKANLSADEKPSFHILHISEDVSIHYQDATIVKEEGKEVTLIDQIPELEI